MNKLSLRKLWLALLTVAGLGLVLFIGVVLAHRKPKHEVLFRMFFPSAPIPQSFRPVAFGDHTTIFGDGRYILAFNISSADVRSIVREHGFAQVPIDSDPTNWNLEYCNESVAFNTEVHLVGKNLTITPLFECYSQENTNTRVRLFYDDQQDLAVVMGFGRFKKLKYRDK